MCAVLASRLMVPRKQGLIVNVSSRGGLSYFFNVAYGIGKEAVSVPRQICHDVVRKWKIQRAEWPVELMRRQLVFCGESFACGSEKSNLV